MLDPRQTLILIRNDEESGWQDRTANIESFVVNDSGVTIIYARGAGKTYTYRADRATVCTPGTPVPIPPQHHLSVRDDPGLESDVEVVEFSGPEGPIRKILRTDRSGKEKSYWYPADQVRIVPDARLSSPQSDTVMRYFHKIIQKKDPEDDPIVRPYQSFDFVHPESVLATYLSASLPDLHEAPKLRVFPFEGNISQQEAVEQALTHRISIIEGPPGTGKTETILNLIANIVVGDLGSVAVVSLSNAAVENVADKLGKRGFGHIVANLGNQEKRKVFFSRQDTRNQAAAAFAEQAPPAPDPNRIAQLNGRIRRLQAADRERAEAKALLAKFKLEQEHFERHRDHEASVDLDRLSLLRRNPSRILAFLAEAAVEAEFDDKPGLLGRIRKFFRYGRTQDIDIRDVEVVLALQSAYYRRRIAELQERIAKLDRELADARFEELAAERQLLSQEAFAAAVASRFSEHPDHTYDSGELWKQRLFRSFVRDYPVVLSTCHSLRSNIPHDYLFDYLIIDEASQVDLLSAGLAMSVCRNLVIVGDRKQLPQISNLPPGIPSAPMPPYDYGEQSILSSVQLLYGEAVPRTLLREHYRCHPAIIGFCNQAFYDGELIPYTSAEDRFVPALRVQSTARGNHMRQHRGGGKSNQRELDVILNEVLPGAPPGIGPDDIALAAPYRQQVIKAEAQLSDQIDTIDTVHKLQGRDKKMVVLTTVLSETWQGVRGLQFVDDPKLINVAVSRAVDAFVLVTNFERLPKSRYIRDLIGYIEYQYPDEVPEPSTVVSVFDLLYRDYEEQLAPLAARLNGNAKYKSEEIIRVLLSDILAEQQYTHLRAKSQIYLRNLVPPGTVLNEEQTAFVRRTSSVDFVVYNAVTKLPLLAIEVDGFAWHENNPEQLQRDRLKDSVLERIGLPLLRLHTTESAEGERIRAALTSAEA